MTGNPAIVSQSPGGVFSGSRADANGPFFWLDDDPYVVEINLSDFSGWQHTTNDYDGFFQLAQWADKDYYVYERNSVRLPYNMLNQVGNVYPRLCVIALMRIPGLYTDDSPIVAWRKDGTCESVFDSSAGYFYSWAKSYFSEGDDVWTDLPVEVHSDTSEISKLKLTLDTGKGSFSSLIATAQCKNYHQINEYDLYSKTKWPSWGVPEPPSVLFWPLNENVIYSSENYIDVAQLLSDNPDAPFKAAFATLGKCTNPISDEGGNPLEVYRNSLIASDQYYTNDKTRDCEYYVRAKQTDDGEPWHKNRNIFRRLEIHVNVDEDINTWCNSKFRDLEKLEGWENVFPEPGPIEFRLKWNFAGKDFTSWDITRESVGDGGSHSGIYEDGDKSIHSGCFNVASKFVAPTLRDNFDRAFRP